MLQTLRRWAKLLKSDVVALWFAYRNPLTPWYARLFAVLVVAYAFSPIDLIPDFIPVIGLLDDAILLPVGIWLALKLVPAPVMAESRQQAQSWLDARKPKPQNYFAAALFIALWILAAWLLWRWLAE
ncbi:MAG: YkvA family protein [Burkholderiales bacterium]